MFCIKKKLYKKIEELVRETDKQKIAKNLLNINLSIKDIMKAIEKIMSLMQR